MKIRIIAVVIFTFLVDSAFSQYENLDDIPRGVIKENSIFLCTEYPKYDSVAFFQERKQGFYSKFDRNGRLIEKNFLNMGDDIHEKELHLIYNDKGQNIMWLWYDSTLVPKIARIRIEEFDTLDNNVGYRDFSSNGTPRDYEIHKYTPTHRWDSTSFSNKTIDYEISNSEPFDTSRTRTAFYTGTRVDSILYQKANDPRERKEVYNYMDDNLVDHHYVVKDRWGKVVWKKTTWYNENGLPLEREYFDHYKAESITTHTCFSYIYYEDD